VNVGLMDALTEYLDAVAAPPAGALSPTPAPAR